MTQTNKDTTVLYSNITGSTRIVDAAGIEYQSSSIQVGSQIFDSKSGYITTFLVKDIPLQLSATFTDVPTSVQDVALVELGFYSTDLKCQFRNTKITESKSGNTPAIKKKK